MNLAWASLAATVVLVVAVGSLLLRHALFANNPIAILIQVLAGLLMLWARLTLGWRSFHAAANPTSGGVITKGPYHLFRHPIYAAILYFMWAGVLSHGSALNMLLAAVATAMIAVRMASEERLLVGRYPEYAAYASRTKRVIPFLF